MCDVNLSAAMQALTTTLTAVGLKMLGAIVPEQHYSVRGVESSGSQQTT